MKSDSSIWISIAQMISRMFLFMIDHLPDLEYVVVSESIVSDIEQERPDLGVIGV